MPSIEFFFEFASTYSYPCAMRIETVAAQKDVEIVWRPFLLGPIFKAQTGVADSVFNIHPEKGAYMWRDVKRICEGLDLPFTRPDQFPQNGLHAARIACVLLDDDQAMAVNFIKAVYRTNFSENTSISDETILAGLITEIGGDADEIMSLSASQEAKNALKINTEMAVARNVFGAPTFFTPDGEMFWGNDRLEEALDWARPHAVAQAGI